MQIVIVVDREIRRQVLIHTDEFRIPLRKAWPGWLLRVHSHLRSIRQMDAWRELNGVILDRSKKGHGKSLAPGFQ
ncbi:MAG: hypothetical protein ACAI37_19950, partial [Chthoniobacter sp.]